MKKLYSYAELKGKIKVGDIVSAEVGYQCNCKQLTPYGILGKITAVGENKFFINDCAHPYDHSEGWLNLHESPRQPTWEDLRVGDVLIDDCGRERIIYEITGKIIWVFDDCGIAFGIHSFSAPVLEANKWTIKQLEPEKEEKTIEIDGKKLTLTQLKEAVKKLEE